MSDDRKNQMNNQDDKILRTIRKYKKNQFWNNKKKIGPNFPLHVTEHELKKQNSTLLGCKKCNFMKTTWKENPSVIL